MSTVSAHFAAVLQQKHHKKDDDYLYHINNSTREIIATLGGMHNVLQLCLQHDSDQKHFVNDEQLQSLNTLLFSEQLQSLNTVLFSVQHTTQLTQSTSQELNNPKKFKSLLTQKKAKGPVVFLVDTHDNLYHKLLKKWPHIADICYYKFAISKYYLLAFGMLSVILFFHIMLYHFDIYQMSLNKKEWIDFTMQIVFFLLFLVPVFALQLNIMRETTKTFDFLFKMTQFIMLAISATVIGTSEGWAWWNMIVLGGAVFMAFSMVIFIDAANWFYKSKMIALCIAVCILYGMNLFVYLKYGDVKWDPFPNYGGDVTQISFKNLMMNSLTNFATYTLKPLISTLMSVNRDGKLMKKDQVIKATGLASRPFFKWKNDKSKKIKHLSIKQLSKRVLNLDHMENMENYIQNNQVDKMIKSKQTVQIEMVGDSDVDKEKSVSENP